MLVMPLGVLLKSSRRKYDRKIVARSADELQTHGQTLLRESARNR